MKGKREILSFVKDGDSWRKIQYGLVKLNVAFQDIYNQKTGYLLTVYTTTSV